MPWMRSRKLLPLVFLLAAPIAAGAAERAVTTPWKAETRQVGPSLVRTARTEGHLLSQVGTVGPELILGFQCAEGAAPMLVVGVGAVASEPMALLGERKPPQPVPLAFEFLATTPHWLNRTIGDVLGEGYVPDMARTLDAQRRTVRTVLGEDFGRRGASRVAAVRGDDMLALAQLVRTSQSVTVHMDRDGATFSLRGAADAMNAAGCPTPVR